MGLGAPCKSCLGLTQSCKAHLHYPEESWADTGSSVGPAVWRTGGSKPLLLAVLSQNRGFSEWGKVETGKREGEWGGGRTVLWAVWPGEERGTKILQLSQIEHPHL